MKAKPQPSPFTEYLTIGIPQLSTDEATVVIRWENISVPFKVGTNTTPTPEGARARFALRPSAPQGARSRSFSSKSPIFPHLVMNSFLPCANHSHGPQSDTAFSRTKPRVEVGRLSSPFRGRSLGAGRFHSIG